MNISPSITINNIITKFSFRCDLNSPFEINFRCRDNIAPNEKIDSWREHIILSLYRAYVLRQLGLNIKAQNRQHRI